MKIIGMYEDWTLVEQNDKHVVVKRSTKKVLFAGSKEDCIKVFVLLISGLIKDEEL